MTASVDQSEPQIRARAIIRGKYVSTDLTRVRRFFTDLLGMEVVQPTPDMLLAREAGHGPGGARRGQPYWALQVNKVDTVSNPQAMLNHWGVDLSSTEEVDAAHALVTEHAEEYGIVRVQRPRSMHNSYSFYFYDVDANWWEVEYRTPEFVYPAIRERGDWKETA